MPEEKYSNDQIWEFFRSGETRSSVKADKKCGQARARKLWDELILTGWEPPITGKNSAVEHHGSSSEDNEPEIEPKRIAPAYYFGQTGAVPISLLIRLAKNKNATANLRQVLESLGIKMTN